MANYRRNRPTIGVLTGWQVFTGVVDSFLEHVIRGIQAAARERDCNLLLACGTSSALTFDVARPAWPILNERVDFVPVGPWNCDGLIITPTMSVKACEQFSIDLEAKGLPVVFAGLQRFGAGVGPDNVMGIRRAVKHLYDHGHRRIAFIAGFDFDFDGDSGSRLTCFKEALEEFGLPFDPSLVAYGSHEYRKGVQAMQQILASKSPFSAVMASNDLSAMGASEALRQAGRHIPRDVALIGFDNRIETRAQVPPLTTIHFPMYEMGYQSLEMILDRLEGKVQPKELRLIPTHLVVRESCGCSPGEGLKANLHLGTNHLSAALGESSGGRPDDADSFPAGVLSRLANDREMEQNIASIIQTESHHMQRRDAGSFSKRFTEAFRTSLGLGDSQLFLKVFQEILDQVADGQNDLYVWQYAITILRENPDVNFDTGLSREEVDTMLDRARVMASEAARAQSTRNLISQGQLAEQLEIMTNRFFAAQDEDEIYHILHQYLPILGVEQSAVLSYRPKGEDAFGWSALQSQHEGLTKGRLFDTYQFPDPELFSEEGPFHLAIVPLTIGKELNGYAALKMGPLEPLSDIVRQLGSSLYAVRLRQEALEGQRAAEEANRLKSRFLSMVSHELRAPLNLITGLSDILLKNKDTQNSDDFSWDDLERIYGSAQHLDGLIQDVLDLALSDVGQLKITCEPLNLQEVLNSVAAICMSLIRDKGLTFRYDVAGDLPRIWGDRTRLRQVILNLLHNAIKFTEKGEVALQAAVTDGGMVTVSVSDTGIGISPEDQDMIFEEFRQSERTVARGFGGLGLGLAICKRLVELHGGEIKVFSTGRKDQGAVFSFTLLPIEEEAVSLPRPRESQQGPRVLLLVKNQANAENLKQFLASKGSDVGLYTIGDGNEWLSWMLIFNPDVVIMDLELTSQRGWEVLKVMKENPATQEMPVLFYNVSGDGQNGSLLELDYLTKPVKSTALAEALLDLQVNGLKGTTKSGPAVLVIDDDPNTVELHTRMVLSQFPQMRVLQAYNGRQALDMILREPPALVLLDLLMPEMDGFAVLNEMREHPLSQDIPIVVITSQSLTDHDIARLNRGTVSILGKNIFSKDEMLNHIAAFVENRCKRGSEVQQAILKAMAFIHANYKEPISRQNIAARVGLSERHLDRCFQQGLGISPMTYLNRYRVNQARILMDTRKMGITAVAMEVGFSSSGYFARVFRDEMGISPRDYIRNKNRAV